MSEQSFVYVFFFFQGYGQISMFGSVGAKSDLPAVALARGTGMTGDMSLGDLILLTRSVPAIVGNMPCCNMLRLKEGHQLSCQI